MKKLITYTLLLLLPLAACKKEYKYPEDPKKSRKSPNERLGGAWYISEYTLNGVSIKDTLNKLTNADITAYRLEYLYNERGELRLQIVGYFGGNGTYQSTEAFKDFHYIFLRSYYDTFDKVFVTPFKSVSNTTTKWEVTKLYDKDLHLKLVTDTGEYRITFIKQ